MIIEHDLPRLTLPVFALNIQLFCFKAMTIAIREITVGPPILQIWHMILSFMMAKTANVFHGHILSALFNK